MGPRFLASERVEAFWDDARARAAPDQQTGYLTDAWPSAVGAHRFAAAAPPRVAHRQHPQQEHAGDGRDQAATRAVAGRRGPSAGSTCN